MNKIKQILIGASILALSGSASAIMIHGNNIEDVGSLIPVVEGILSGDIVSNITQKRENRLAKNYRKYGRASLVLEAGDLNGKRQENVTNRMTRKANKMMKIASKLQYQEIAISTIEEGNGEGGDTGIPEPSTIALLGLGLVGIGAARRLRKKAH